MGAKPLRDFSVSTVSVLERSIAAQGQPRTMLHGVVVATRETEMPTPERLQHGDFVMAETQRAKETRIVARALDTRDRLLRDGVIDRRQSDTWRWFAAKFHAAALDPLRAANLMRAPGGDGAGDGILEARDSVRSAIERLGGVDGSGRMPALPSAIWWICGAGHSLSEFARMQRWGRGGYMDPRTASGLVVAGLTVMGGR